MKKSIVLLMAVSSLLLGLSCGPSAADQEKEKQEILQIEASHNAVDSTEKAVAKTAAELDSLLKLLNAN
jgi:ABC-type Zn uptake system ZnuABC Zn-binding protein ZnuA